MHHLRNGEPEGGQIDHLPLFGQFAGAVQDETGQGIILRILGEVQAMQFPQVGHFEPGAKEEFVRVQAFVHVLGGIVLVVNIAHDGFHHILHGEHAGGTTELVHHHGHVRALFDEELQHFIGRHGAGNEVHGPQHHAYGARPAEELVAVYIADHVVDAVLVHEQFAHAGIGEAFVQGFHVLVHIDGLYAGARHHEFAHFDAAEFERVLDVLHLGIEGVLLGVACAELAQELIQINAPEGELAGLGAHPEDAQHPFADAGHEHGGRP